MCRPYFLLVQGLFLLACLCPALTAAPIPHLVFTKEISLQEKTRCFTYTVGQGDYIYAILRSFDIPEDELGAWAKRIIELNPQLEDPDTLQPGVSLNLPQSLKNRSKQDSARAAVEKDRTSPPPDRPQSPSPPAIASQPHTVSPGDSAKSLLQSHLPDADNATRAVYMNLFQKMNPGLEGQNPLPPGQTVYIPRPGPQTAAQRPQNATRLVSAPDPKPSDTPRPQPDNKRLVISQLSHLGLDFASGRELLYPAGDGQWVRINLQRMPLASTPWGKPVLFAPDNMPPDLDKQVFTRAGLIVCPVPGHWSPPQAFEALEAAFPRSFIAWSRQAPMIMNRHGISIEVQARTMLVSKDSGRQNICLFSAFNAPADTLPNLLLGFLRQQGIKVLQPASGNASTSWTAPTVPPLQALHIPTLTPLQVARKLPSVRSAQSSPSSSIAIDDLQTTGLLGQKTLRLSWNGEHGINITLRIPCLQPNSDQSSQVFLPARQADPYLVALLNLMGYSAYKLSS